MTSEAKQRIQLALGLAIVVAGLRAGYILYERHEQNVEDARKQAQSAAGYSNADYYVTPKKLYPYDVKSAKQLTKQPVWAKEGYRYTYYPYNAATKRVDFKQDAGLLLPIEKLQIKDVVTDIPAGAGNRRQVLAVFDKDSKSFAVPIGFENDEQQYKIYSDEMFYIEDPHDLYKHWPPDIWQAVEQHHVKPGMNELQADFAIGMGVPDSGGSEDKTVRYPNGGKPLVIVYQNGKAAEVTPGKPSS